jgi:DNA-binding response OmpR family regulator
LRHLLNRRSSAHCKALPDIILMDAVMPSFGFETSRRLKRNKAPARMPVLFMTGFSET